MMRLVYSVVFSMAFPAIMFVAGLAVGHWAPSPYAMLCLAASALGTSVLFLKATAPDAGYSSILMAWMGGSCACLFVGNLTAFVLRLV